MPNNWTFTVFFGVIGLHTILLTLFLAITHIMSHRYFLYLPHWGPVPTYTILSSTMQAYLSTTPLLSVIVEFGILTISITFNLMFSRYYGTFSSLKSAYC